VYLPNEVQANKLTLCSELMIFIGYEDNGYRFMHHIQGNIIFHSTQAIFDEGHFPKRPNSHSGEKMPPRCYKLLLSLSIIILFFYFLFYL